MGPSRSRRAGRRPDRSNLWAGLASAAALALVGLYLGARLSARQQRIDIDETSRAPSRGRPPSRPSSSTAPIRLAPNKRSASARSSTEW
jgi:hypothetical protein